MTEIFIGTDIVEVKRIKHLINRYKSKFLTKIFFITEQEYCNSRSIPEIHYAGRFAAKEAIIKAIKSSGFDQTFSLKDIKIINYSDGSPHVELDFEYKGDIKVSISHTQTHAVAFALSKITSR